jgi:hypothetical protein
VIALLQNSLACIHRRTGELWWELPLSHGYDEHSCAPLYREPQLVVAGPFHSGAQAFRLERDGDRCRPVPEWLCDQLSNDVASSVLVDETIFGFDLKDMQSRLHRPSRGGFRAVDWLTGQVRWSSAEPGHAQIIVADGKLVLFNDRGELVLALASAEGYDELGRLAIFPDEICWTAPALSDGRLFLRTQTRAACIYLGRRPLNANTSAVAAADLPASSRFDPGSLLGGEREYPATLPEQREFIRWFLWCLGLLATVGILSLAVSFTTNRRPSPFPAAADDSGLRHRLGHIIFWASALISGAAGSVLIHRAGGDYVFTWPLALWAVFGIAVSFSWQARRSQWWSWSRARSYLTGLAFLAACALYFHLCRWLGLAIEWGFLTGFAAALPAALLTAWLAGRPPGRFSLIELIAHLASFSLYYWGCVAFMHWRMGSVG